MTREEAINEINKVFEPAFANYIITALTEGATVSDKEPTTKNDLGVDCISRKAVLDITWQDPSYADPLNVLTEVRDKVRELPSVIPQKPRWIPVAERLPEESNEYLVSTVWEDVTTDYFRTDSGWMTFEKKEILAWMPLPQPYRGESEDKE